MNTTLLTVLTAVGAPSMTRVPESAWSVNRK